MKKASHSAYSSDLTLSDFYLFKNMRRELSGRMFKSVDELFSAIRAIFDQFKKSTLIAAFQELMMRLRVCNKAKSDYFGDFNI
jgi:hypothetical protein